MQIPGQKWFPLLKGFPPAEPSAARRGKEKTQRALARRVARAMTLASRRVMSIHLIRLSEVLVLILLFSNWYALTK